MFIGNGWSIFCSIPEHLATRTLVNRDNDGVVGWFSLLETFLLKGDLFINGQNVRFLALKFRVSSLQVILYFPRTQGVLRQNAMDQALTGPSEARETGLFGMPTHVISQELDSPKLMWVPKVRRLAAGQFYDPCLGFG
jgi:hypothetical protein